MKTLTIFTPTYNRAYILPQLYKSLCKENCKDFIWLIVDDGSVDGTENLVKQWQNEKIVDIAYFKQPNGGKMRAHNYGVKKCITPLFFCIDSDDYLVEKSISNIIKLYPKIRDNKDICGFIAKRKILNRKSSPNLPNAKIMTLQNLYNYGFVGDTSLVFKTSILKNFLFPEIEGEKFITEAYIYDQIDMEYQYLLVDEFWIICKYLEDGYTYNNHNLFLKNPKGWILYYKQRYKLSHSFKRKCHCVLMYISISLIEHEQISSIIKNSPSNKFLTYMIYPLGLRFYKKNFITIVP